LAVRGAVTLIRNSLLPPGKRLPSSPNPGARTHGRLRIEVPVSIMPAAVGDNRVAITSECPISARTCDLSLGGIGLVHSTPLPCRYAVIAFSAGAPVWLVVELVRSSLQGQDAWVSGARIVGVIKSGEAPGGIL
jgi:hypothetical protein